MVKQSAAWIVKQKQDGVPLVVGISGAQGTGKSTLAQQIKDMLTHTYSVAILSLDDLYLSQEKRDVLAQNIHPLFKIRGVPTTHDVALGIQTLEQLKSGQGDVLLPRFDKQIDNPKPKEDWDICQSPVDIVLFEGWCLGLTAQKEGDLIKPINALERNEDEDGVWRKQVNDVLKAEFQALFGLVDTLIYLQAPSSDTVFEWRKQQELETFANQADLAMNDAELTRFMAHFERLTRHGLTTLPQQADVVIRLGEQHQCLDIVCRD